jgi:FKBP-type peptidyl-prolyl cis-trans isomerase FkpA
LQAEWAEWSLPLERKRMKKLLGMTAVVAVIAAACNTRPPAPSPSPAGAALASEDDKTIYAAGYMLGKNVGPLSLTPQELELVQRGFTDAATGKQAQVDLQSYLPKVQAFAQERARRPSEADKAKAGAEKAKSQSFLDSAAKEPGAEKTASGLVFRSVLPGKGRSPAPTDVVRVHYRGTLTDGTEFDSSIARGQPAEFPLNQVIPCWTEGVARMKVGEKARLVCPSEIAYGDKGSPPTIPPGATLVFEVELLDIVKR